MSKDYYYKLKNNDTILNNTILAISLMSHSANFRGRDCTVCFEAYEKGVTSSFVGEISGNIEGRAQLFGRK